VGTTFSKSYFSYLIAIFILLTLIFQALMIGDDLVNDIGGAQSCGMRGVLVRSGKYR